MDSHILTRRITKDDCFYFGCHIEAGHFLWEPSLHHVFRSRLPADFPLAVTALDGGLFPRGEVPGKDGTAYLHLPERLDHPLLCGSVS